MIQKYVFGTPFPTDAVVMNMEPAKDSLPFFTVDEQGSFTYALAEDDIVYGLGEQIRGINKEAGSMSAGTMTIPIIMNARSL